jgi:hypothetical protein
MQDVKDRYFKTPPLLIKENLGAFFTGASWFAAHSANDDC